MAKKVKCVECDNSMDWSIPNDETLRDNSFLRDTLKNTVVCGYTMKTKGVNHCQYCKHYEHEEKEYNRNDRRKRYEEELNKRLSKLDLE